MREDMPWWVRILLAVGVLLVAYIVVTLLSGEPPG
jgi:hypothetical protein